MAANSVDKTVCARYFRHTLASRQAHTAETYRKPYGQKLLRKREKVTATLG